MRTRLHWVALALLMALMAGLPGSVAARHYEIDRPTGFDGDPTGGLYQFDNVTGGSSGMQPPPGSPGPNDRSTKSPPLYSSQDAAGRSGVWFRWEMLLVSLPCHHLVLLKTFAR